MPDLAHHGKVDTYISGKTEEIPSRQHVNTTEMKRHVPSFENEHKALRLIYGTLLQMTSSKDILQLDNARLRSKTPEGQTSSLATFPISS